MRRRAISCSLFMLSGGYDVQPVSAHQSGPPAKAAQAQATDRRASVDPTEAAIRDQISCREPPRAAVAINAMLRNNIIRDTGEGADGSNEYAPVGRLSVFGFAITRLTGWQADAQGHPMPPFGRGPGTMPPNFFAVTVEERPDRVRAELARQGLADAIAIEAAGSEGTSLTCYREAANR